MVLLAKLLMITLSLIILTNPTAHAMQEDGNVTLTFITPITILEQIKKISSQSDQKIGEFIDGLENELLTIYEKTLSNIVDCNGYNVLHLACERGEQNVAQIIVTKTAQNKHDFITQSTKWGLNALMLAVYNNHLAIVRLLLNALSDNLKDCIFLCTKNKQNIFHIAANSGNNECFTLLVERAMQIDSAIIPTILLTQDNRGNTPLHIARSKLKNDVAKTICDYAAQAKITNKVLTITNNDGNTASQLTPCTIL